MNSLRVVPCRVEQLSEVIELHRKVFASSMNAKLGAHYTKMLVNWFSSDSQRILLTGLGSDGRVLGYVFGAPTISLIEMNQALLWPALLGITMRPWLLGSREFRRVCFKRIAQMVFRTNNPSALNELPKPMVSLVGIGVDESARGLKLGTLLMHEFVQAAKSRGAQSLELTVRHENQAAIALYEKCKWRRIEEEHEPGSTVQYFYLLK